MNNKILVRSYGWAGSFVSVSFQGVTENYFNISKRDALNRFKAKYMLYGVGASFC